MAEHEEHTSLKTVSTTIADFLKTPKDFLAKIFEENLGRLEVQLSTRQLFVMSKEMFELFVKLEVRKERTIFEQKYQELKNRFTKKEEEVKFDTLTKAQQTLIQLERKFQLFHNMNSAELLSVVENINLLRLGQGEKVFTINNTTKEMFFIISGVVSITINDNEVALLQKNSFFGEMAYIANKPRNATATVKSDSAILLTFRVKPEVDINKSEAFMKLFQNITNMLVLKVEEMNRKLYSNN